VNEILAIGFFDGVHLGHQAILKGATSVLTFVNHPRSVLSPSSSPDLLMDAQSRIDAIKSCGVQNVYALEFTREIANIEPRDFIENSLPGLTFGIKDLQKVRCGENWRFGKGGGADAQFLRRYGVSVDVVPYAEYAGEKISSTRIRSVLSDGDIESVNAMIGRRLSVVGKVVAGKGEGRKHNAPTVNVMPLFIPKMPYGVYLVNVAGAYGVANWGVAPTMRRRAWAIPVLEIHFFSSPDGIGDEIKVEFASFIRPERLFQDEASLFAQIRHDIAAAKEKCVTLSQKV
jgi:riboflavin kinase/FMN adenylyltransferase